MCLPAAAEPLSQRGLRSKVPASHSALLTKHREKVGLCRRQACCLVSSSGTSQSAQRPGAGCVGKPNDTATVAVTAVKYAVGSCNRRAYAQHGTAADSVGCALRSGSAPTPKGGHKPLLGALSTSMPLHDAVLQQRLRAPQWAMLQAAAAAHCAFERLRTGAGSCGI